MKLLVKKITLIKYDLYSESEYSMTKGQWQNRLWDEETYSRLLEVKQTWDPEHVFQCRHCIGDEEQPIRVNEKTLPSWRHFDPSITLLWLKPDK